MRQKPFFTLCFLVTFVIPLHNPVFAEESCSSNPKQAFAHARAELASGDLARHQKGLICLLEAVEAVEARLDDLIAGKIEFAGPVVAPEFLYRGQIKESSQ